jgi:hypothetical protein
MFAQAPTARSASFFFFFFFFNGQFPNWLHLPGLEMRHCKAEPGAVYMGALHEDSLPMVLVDQRAEANARTRTRILQRGGGDSAAPGVGGPALVIAVAVVELSRARAGEARVRLPGVLPAIEQHVAIGADGAALQQAPQAA